MAEWVWKVPQQTIKGSDKGAVPSIDGIFKGSDKGEFETNKEI